VSPGPTADDEPLPLAGYTVAVTAARRKEELGALLDRRGARVVHAPAIRIVPLADDTELVAATRAVLAAPVDLVVATTGVGFRGWLEAADAWEDLGCPFEAALALARSGEGDALTEAVSRFEAMGAQAAAARARTLLRSRGLPQPRGPRASTRAHPAGLTSRQAEVLDLLRGGLSDAEIADRLVLSRRTVEHHVAAILAKLGVGSRREAARAAVGNVGTEPEADG
jgi:DNA-binding CsgD family transcriptional regulator